MDIEFSSRGFLTAFFRHKWKAFLVLVVIVLAGVAYVANQTPMYEAKSRLLVKFGREAMLDLSRPDSQPMVELKSDKKDIINSYVSLLGSRDLLRQAVEEFGAARLYPANEKREEPATTGQAVNRLLYGDLEPVVSSESNVIELSIYNVDPVVAKAFSEVVIDHFVRRQAAIYNPTRTGFLDGQVEEARLALLTAQDSFLAFKNETGIADLEKETAELIEEKSDISSISFSALTEAREELAELRTERANLLATHRPDSLMVRKLDQSIASVQAHVEDLRRDLAQAFGDDVETAHLGDAVAGAGVLSARLQEINQRMEYLDSKRGRYEELQNKVEAAEENYYYYQKRGEEARVSNVINEQNITRITVIDHPHASSKPVRPRTSLIVIAAVIAGLLGAVGIAFFMELIDDRLTSPRHLARALNAPVFVTYDRKEK